MQAGAAQGIDFDRVPAPGAAPAPWLKSLPLVEAQLAAIRARVAFLERDRYLAPDIEAMRLWALRTCWPEALRRILPSSAS